MTIRAFIYTCLLTGSVLLSSCAYMQTHKNINQQQSGYSLKPALELYRAGDAYYLAVEKHQIEVHYPIIYDSIFLTGNNNPHLEICNTRGDKLYRKISQGTALVLQHKTGYADIAVLSDELKNNPSPWLSTLPAQAKRCNICAEITGTAETWLDTENTASSSLSTQAASTLVQVCVDWPGTILYNAAIPIMAPFVFFYEFLNEE